MDRYLRKVSRKKLAGSQSSLAFGLFTPIQCCLGGLFCLALAAFAAYGAYRNDLSPLAVVRYFCWSSVKAAGLVAPISGRTELWFKPQTDLREYEIGRLSNGIQVLAVQDNRSLFASFAVAVQAGSFDDPADLPGLAHFCEHMLFLGTKKYPDSSEFDRFVDLNAGSQNAYTGDEVTVYFFTVSQEAAEEGLERFADFFAQPLFNRSGVQKEVQAIDSEHQKNIQSPAWRNRAVLNALANPESPVAGFGTGNLKTLKDGPQAKGIDVVEALRTYWETHYCPEKMHVVSFGPAATGKQLEALSKSFGEVSSKSLACSTTPRKSFAKPDPWPASQVGKYIYIEGTTLEAGLAIIFYLPDLSSEFASKPWRYVEEVLGYSGAGSLLQLLRDRLNLISDLDTSVGGSSASWEFTLTFELTELGQNHSSDVLDAFFAYLASVRIQGVDPAVHETMVRRGELDWMWSEPGDGMDLATNLAEALTRLPAYHLLWADNLITDPKLDLVAETFAKLDVERMNIAYVLPKTETLKARGISPELKDPNYGVKHSVKSLENELLEHLTRWRRWQRLATTERKNVFEQEAKQEFLAGLRAAVSRSSDGISADSIAMPRIPPPISTMPSKVTLDMAQATIPPASKGTDSHLFGERPEAIPLGTAPENSGISGEMQLWYRSGWSSNLPIGSPRAAVGVFLRAERPAEAAEETATNSIRMQLYNIMIGEEMAPYLVDLEAGGGSFGLVASADGISFALWDYPSTLNAFAETALQQFTAHESLSDADEGRYQRVAHSVRQSLQSRTAMPISYALGAVSELLTKGAHSQDDLLEALNSIDQSQVSASLQEIVFRYPMQMTSLSMGNIDFSTGAQTVRKVIQELPWQQSQSEKATGEIEYVTPIVSPSKPVQLIEQNPRSGDDNHVAVVTILGGIATLKGRILVSVLGDLLGQVAFEVLRTELQLGYVASGRSRRISNIQGVECYVQGNARNASELETAIHRVLSKDMPKRLASLSIGDLDHLKEGFRSSIKEQPLHTGEEWEHWWNPVADNTFCFSLRDALLRELDALQSPKTLLDQWNSLVLPTSEGSTRKIITVKYFSSNTSSVPVQPSLEEATASWAQAGLDPTYVELLKREHSEALVLSKANAASRQAILEAGGKYYPSLIECGPRAREGEGKGTVQASLLELEAETSAEEATVQEAGGISSSEYSSTKHFADVDEQAIEAGRDKLSAALGIPTSLEALVQVNAAGEAATISEAQISSATGPRFARARHARSFGTGNVLGFD
mmetsp:Transcript_9171/g.19931  ORF Transcript_9171/g.19931 Transcript_9171/m.19931 type:complete len:1268 (+) Transcript_9171:357-4160(+)